MSFAEKLDRPEVPALMDAMFRALAAHLARLTDADPSSFHFALTVLCGTTGSTFSTMPPEHVVSLFTDYINNIAAGAQLQ